MHVAFAARDNAMVDEFHRAAIEAGGQDFGKPGPREAGYYGAFVLDPDGNNIEAVARP
jgi:predicted lactoylglutathione lyase